MKRLLTSTALLAAAAYGLNRQQRRVDDVAPDLRHPQLYVPLSLRGQRSLQIGRKLLAAQPAGTIADGVQMQTEHVPRAENGTSLDVVVYEPSGREEPTGALVWIHGGGLVMGTPETGHELCSRFAADLGIVVISVDYRLAPEHPFPAGLEDCLDALTWLHDNAEPLGIATDRVAVGGDSAGAGLAACLTQMTHDRGGPSIRFQLLQYPMLDDRTALRTDHDALVWSNSSNRFAWSAYLGHAPTEDEPRPYASASRRTDLAGLPPAWIGVGDIDLFHDESVEYARRLDDAGVSVELHIEPGMYHAAEHVVPTAPAMLAFRNRMVTALGSALAVEVPAH